MNFLGHARVAFQRGAEPRVVLGAMLPDFASMSRSRLLAVGEPRTRAGVALHHATDDVFHGAETFIALNAQGIDTLEAAGLGRGPARAVAHVGIELLLDGLLLGEPALEAAYLEAIALPATELELSFRGDGAARFEALQARLRSHGLPNDYRWPDRVAERLEQILARRPRLALRPEDRPRVIRYLEEARATLEHRLERLLTEVDEGLRPFATDLGAPRRTAIAEPRARVRAAGPFPTD